LWWWAHAGGPTVVSAKTVAEYRAYTPDIASRTRDFIKDLDWTMLVASIK
jgi:hypothetical protein